MRLLATFLLTTTLAYPCQVVMWMVPPFTLPEAKPVEVNLSKWQAQSSQATCTSVKFKLPPPYVPPWPSCEGSVYTLAPTKDLEPLLKAPIHALRVTELMSQEVSALLTHRDAFKWEGSNAILRRHLIKGQDNAQQLLLLLFLASMASGDDTCDCGFFDYDTIIDFHVNGERRRILLSFRSQSIAIDDGELLLSSGGLSPQMYDFLMVQIGLMPKLSSPDNIPEHPDA